MEYCIHNKSVSVVINNASNFVKALKESTATEVFEEEDNAITIKSEKRRC